MGGATVDNVKQALSEYKARRSDLPDLELSALYALFPKEIQLETGAPHWPNPWPNTSCAGVYFIFGRSGRLLYVGKASMKNCIDDRLYGHFRTGKSPEECRLVHSVGRDGWIERPMYVATVAVPREMAFEAPALEEYLIGKLSPVNNMKGLGCAV